MLGKIKEECFDRNQDRKDEPDLLSNFCRLAHTKHPPLQQRWLPRCFGTLQRFCISHPHRCWQQDRNESVRPAHAVNIGPFETTPPCFSTHMCEVARLMPKISLKRYSESGVDARCGMLWWDATQSRNVKSSVHKATSTQLQYVMIILPIKVDLRFLEWNRVQWMVLPVTTSISLDSMALMHQWVIEYEQADFWNAKVRTHTFLNILYKHAPAPLQASTQWSPSGCIWWHCLKKVAHNIQGWQ